MLRHESGLGRRKVIILGLDGATFDLLGPWMEAGLLPGLTRATREGSHGELESTIPPYTAPAWASFATGKNPGKHGITSFGKFAPAGRERLPVSSRSVAGQTLWEIASEQGKKVGVVNTPVTYPPTPVNGFMVTGPLTPAEDSEYTFPQGLKKELLSQVKNYRVVPFVTLGQAAWALKKIFHHISVLERACQYLHRRFDPDLFISVDLSFDRIQHFFWNHLDRGHPAYAPLKAAVWEKSILECYEAVDEQVVRSRLSMVDDDTTLFIISDHGFGPAHRRFYVNRFLASLGLLALKSRRDGVAGFLGRRLAGSPEDRTEALRFLEIFGLRRVVSLRLKQRIDRVLDRTLGSPIDWSRTRAFSAGMASEGIYINLHAREKNGIVEPGQEYEALRDLIIRELRHLRDPQTGQSVISRVWRKEEIYHGEQLPLLPDVVFSHGTQPYLPSDRFSGFRIIEDIPFKFGGGRHRPNGILIVLGSHIRRGTLIHGARIIDVAPTVLYAMGLPIPDDMDGRVLEEIFAPAFLRMNPPRFAPASGRCETVDQIVYSPDEAKLIEERLKGLGYTD